MYRTKTYIAADWDNDKDVLEVFEDWKENNNLSFDYRDAHELIVSRDSSLKCSIKKSIREKIKASKKFVLIVGEKTKNLTNGSCHLCDKYIRLWKEICIKNYNVDFRSYIEYECEMAVKDDIEIVVLYKSDRIEKNYCPEILQDKGHHAPMYKKNTTEWDYQIIKKLIC